MWYFIEGFFGFPNQYIWCIICEVCIYVRKIHCCCVQNHLMDVLWLQNESLPSAFSHPLDCSDWSLRLSHVSLTPTSDQSTAARRRVTVDEYIAQRTHKLGALDGHYSERVSYRQFICHLFFVLLLLCTFQCSRCQCMLPYVSITSVVK